MSRVTLGMDLAKNIAALPGVEQSGRTVLVKPRVHREQPAVGIKRQRKEFSCGGIIIAPVLMFISFCSLGGVQRNPGYAFGSTQATLAGGSDRLHPTLGYKKPEAVRAKLVCGDVAGRQIMSASRDTEFRGKVTPIGAETTTRKATANKAFGTDAAY